MNVTGFSDNNNATFCGNQSVEQADEPWSDFTTTNTLSTVIFYVAVTLGIPGNVLSAIVWLRRHIVSQNPSVLYLATLAVNDLVFLIVDIPGRLKCSGNDSWLCLCLHYPVWFTDILDLLLVLCFSVVRLVVIRRPLQVCCITRFTARRHTSAVYAVVVCPSVCLSKAGKVKQSKVTRI